MIDGMVSGKGCRTKLPVLLIGFNRPDLFSGLISSLRLLRPPRVYVSIDGPRRGNFTDVIKCREVREVVSKEIDWPCAIKTQCREQNYGVDRAPPEAITWFFENEEFGVVLEDDVRPSVEFFHFAEELGRRYYDEDRIGVICGFNLYNVQYETYASFYFSKHFIAWGWATWRRVWKHYKSNHSEFTAKAIAEVAAHISCRAMRRRMTKIYLRKNLAWDQVFEKILLANGYINIVPRVRLTINVGTNDVAATHTVGWEFFGDDFSKFKDLSSVLINGKIIPPRKLHEQIVYDGESDKIREIIELNIIQRGFTWLAAKCKSKSIVAILDFASKLVKRFSPHLVGFPLVRKHSDDRDKVERMADGKKQG